MSFTYYLNEVLHDSSLVPFFQILVATILGMIIGIERLLAGRTAGPRTYGLVSLGSCLLTILALAMPAYIGANAPEFVRVDIAGIIASIMTGIGFIGAGLIIFKESKVSGLTTAAGIWVSAAIGISVGMKAYLIAVFTMSMTLFLFSTMWYIENKIRDRFVKNGSETNSDGHYL